MKKGVEVRSGFGHYILYQISKLNLRELKIQSIFNKSLVLPSSFNLKEKDIIFIYNLIIKLIKKYK